MSTNLFILPRSLRFLGVFFFSLGLFAGVTRFYFGIKPEILEIKVFALYSSYLESKFMQPISNNLIEELACFFLVSGLFLIAFSREKNEVAELNAIRLRSFFISAYSNFIFLIVSIFFTYGFAFIYMLMVNLVFGLISYIITFRILVFMNDSEFLNS